MKLRPITGTLIALLLASNAPGAAEAPDYRQRALTLLDLLCDGFSQGTLKTAFPGLVLAEREPLVRNGTTFGWRQQLDFPDGSGARVERLAVNEQVRRLSIEYSDRESRPALTVLAAPDCSIRAAREIEYANGQATSLIALDANLRPHGDPLPVDPAVPAGRDPGGTTIALVDSGVNYLLPAIERNLARDAKHALVGFDFWDMDPRPFDSHPVRSPFFPQRHGTRIASIILREAPRTRLIAYRYPRPDMRRMRELVAHAAAAGVRAMNLSLGGNRLDQWTSFEEAARDFPDILFIVSAGNNGRDIDIHPVYPAALDLDNMLTVTSADRDGYPARGSNWGRKGVDLLVPGEQVPAWDFFGNDRDVSGSSYAAARITALASRILSTSPQLNARALRERLLSLAQQPPHEFVSGGWISEPADLARDLDRASIRIVNTHEPAQPPVDHAFEPDFVVVERSGWDVAQVHKIWQGSSDILSQCGVHLRPARVLTVAAAEGLLDFSRSNARLLTSNIGTSGPRVFFVRDTLDRPAFEAFAFGTDNSRSNPELRFTVWVTKGTQDPHIALAHELAHVLLDDGSHTREPRNLMRRDTSPQNVELTATQCETLRTTALRNGLIN